MNNISDGDTSRHPPVSTWHESLGEGPLQDSNQNQNLHTVIDLDTMGLQQTRRTLKSSQRYQDSSNTEPENKELFSINKRAYAIMILVIPNLVSSISDGWKSISQ